MLFVLALSSIVLFCYDGPGRVVGTEGTPHRVSDDLARAVTKGDRTRVPHNRILIPLAISWSFSDSLYVIGSDRKSYTLEGGHVYLVLDHGSYCARPSSVVGSDYIREQESERARKRGSVSGGYLENVEVFKRN